MIVIPTRRGHWEIKAPRKLAAAIVIPIILGFAAGPWYGIAFVAGVLFWSAKHHEA